MWYKKEKEKYEGMTVEQFIERTMLKRPLCFFTSYDTTLLRDKENTTPPYADWKNVGKEEEGVITLDEYMTYDEIQIAALIGVSVPTFFINNGSRYNNGSKSDNREKFGYYCALVGARFEKKNKMESNHILIQKNINTPDKGYGKKAPIENKKTSLLKIWAKFYNQKDEEGNYCFPAFDEIPPKGSPRYFLHRPSEYVDSKYFNVPVFKSRILMSIEIFLEEANKRAQECKKKAYVHIVGLGLGVWQISKKQPYWMMEVYEEIIKNNKYEFISDLDFSWFPPDCTCVGLKDKEEFVGENGNKITIHFSKRNPADPIDDDGKVLVGMYAWDGNSFPGNEYWRGMLSASGDPAAACCSTIPELQNPYINKEFVKRIKWYGRQTLPTWKEETQPIEEDSSEGESDDQ